MEFTREEKLPGLKLYLAEDNEERKRWYLFEEDFDAEYVSGNGYKIAACITIFWNKQTIDFHVNDFWTHEPRIDYQRKGYGTRIMYYIESELHPQYPNFLVTINNQKEYISFKEYIEGKIRASLNVLVIGVDDSLVHELKAKGYKKIYNIKSYVAALTFLEEHIDIAAHIHLVFLKRFSDEQVQLEVRKHLDAIFSYQPEKYDPYLLSPLPKDKIHFHFFENTLPRIFFYREPLLDSSAEVEYYSRVNYEYIMTTYSSYISYVEKQLFPLLEVSHLKKERLPVVLPISKENKVKKLEDLRILCLTRGDNYSYFKEYLQKKGITHISMFDDGNSSYSRNAFNQLGDYDIVIASDSHSHTLLFNYLEAKEQVKSCGRDTTLLACYSASWVYQRVTLDNRVQYCLIDKEEVIKKDYSFRMSYDDVCPDETHKDHEYVFMRIIETIVREYLDYVNSKGENIPCEQFTTYQQLNSQCEEYIKNMLQEENRKAEEKQKKDLFYQKFDDLRINLLRYLDASRIRSVEKVEEVSIEEQSDYIRVCFLIKGLVKGAINIPKRKQENGRIFTLELQGKSGRLQPAHSVCLRYNEEDGDPSYVSPSEKELQFFEGICKRVDTYINPAVESAIVNSHKPFVPRKKCNKKKMWYNDNRR